MDKIYDYAVLGAGCAGLSLVWHLLSIGFEGSIVLLDRKIEFSNDRTWCFWDVEQTDFSDLASHRWSCWRVIRHDGMGSGVHHVNYRYLRLQSMSFYERVLERLKQNPQITLLLGTPVTSVEAITNGVRVKTSEEAFLVKQVFDSIPRQDSPAGEQRSGSSFEQHFFGRFIKTADSIFDPSCVTLMDFRTEQSRGPHFFYVLPFSPTEALVENTYLMPCIVPEAQHKQEIAAYLSSSYGLSKGAYQVMAEEQGRIPMDSEMPVSNFSERVVRIGLAGGAARSSSGYAFLRIQRQCRWLAKRIMDDSAEDANPLLSPRYKLLDRVFLQAILDHPGSADRLFHALFSNAPTDELLRFMSDCGSLRDDLRVVRSLPIKPFLQALVHLRTGRSGKPA